MRIHRLIALERIRSLGIPGLAGVLLLAACLVFGLVSLVPAHGSLEKLRQQTSRTSAPPTGGSSGIAPASVTPAEQLAQFYAALPPQGAATESLNRIYQAAAKERLTLARGEYSLATTPDSPLARYQIVMPVRGDYGQIRRFIRLALAAVPHLALDELSFQRQSIAEAQLEARIRFTLFLKRETS